MNKDNNSVCSNSGTSVLDILKALIWPLAIIFLLTCNSPIHGIVEGVSNKMNDSTYDFETKIGDKFEAKLTHAKKAQENLGRQDTAGMILAKGEKLTQVSVAMPSAFVAKESKILSDPIINKNTRYWIYIGQKVNGKLMNGHFFINDIPVSGQRIVAKDAVYRRESFPVLLPNGQYQLGRSIGVVGDGESVTIIEIKVIPNDNKMM